MKISSPRNLTDCGKSSVTFYSHAEWHDGKTEPSETETPITEEQTGGGHYHGDVYHPVAHSPEMAQQEAQQNIAEVQGAEADISTIEPL